MLARFRKPEPEPLEPVAHETAVVSIQFRNDGSSRKPLDGTVIVHVPDVGEMHFSREGAEKLYSGLEWALESMGWGGLITDEDFEEYRDKLIKEMG